MQVLSSSWTPREPNFNDILQIFINEGGLDMHRLWLLLPALPLLLIGLVI